MKKWFVWKLGQKIGKTYRLWYWHRHGGEYPWGIINFIKDTSKDTKYITSYTEDDFDEYLNSFK
jgi:hypothetical protein